MEARQVRIENGEDDQTRDYERPVKAGVRGIAKESSEEKIQSEGSREETR